MEWRSIDELSGDFGNLLTPLGEAYYNGYAFHSLLIFSHCFFLLKQPEF